MMMMMLMMTTNTITSRRRTNGDRPTQQRLSTMVFVLVVAFMACTCSALIPSSPQEQTRRAIKSIKNAIELHQQETTTTKSSGGCRLFIDYLIPLPPETVAADIDPWPGGLAQMYPYAETIVQEILQGVVDDYVPGSCSSQVVSASDCCGLVLQESKLSAKGDIAALLFPSVDQLDTIEQVDTMVGSERTLLIFNKQFQRIQDFGMFGNKQAKAQRLIFDTFQQGFAFQELVVRGEDTKLLYEAPTGWSACVICDENVDLGSREINLLEQQPKRPSYDELESKINQVLPEPLWMRKMGEVEEKGFKFQR